MLPDRVSNPGSLDLESYALPTELRGPAGIYRLTPRTNKLSQVPEISCLYGKINALRRDYAKISQWISGKVIKKNRRKQRLT